MYSITVYFTFSHTQPITGQCTTKISNYSSVFLYVYMFSFIFFEINIQFTYKQTHLKHSVSRNFRYCKTFTRTHLCNNSFDMGRMDLVNEMMCCYFLIKNNKIHLLYLKFPRTINTAIYLIACH